LLPVQNKISFSAVEWSFHNENGEEERPIGEIKELKIERIGYNNEEWLPLV
jgi:hypothetical protein